MNVKNGGNCYMFKILDSSFSLKQTEKKETRVETPGSLFKTELLKTLKLKKRRKEEGEEEGGGGETQCRLVTKAFKISRSDQNFSKIIEL